MLEYAPSNRTVGAQTIQMHGGPTFAPDSLSRFDARIMASDHAGGVAIWTLVVSVRRVNSGAPVIIASLPVPKQASAGASTWTANLIVSGDEIVAEVTGGVGQTVDWIFFIPEAMSFSMVGAFQG